jgi:ferredoxin
MPRLLVGRHRQHALRAELDLLGDERDGFRLLESGFRLDQNASAAWTLRSGVNDFHNCEGRATADRSVMFERYVNIAGMPTLTVEGYATVAVDDGMRLVNAIEQRAGVDILHACGGNARCTTCRVEFVSGEPARMTQAEQAKLAEKGLSGVRLSCQIECDHDMTVKV